MFSEETSKEAARQLNLTDQWVIVYASIQCMHLCDAADITDHLELHAEDYETLCCDEITEAVNQSVKNIPLPTGWRLVGMREKDGNSLSKRVFGLVDMSSFGAA